MAKRIIWAGGDRVSCTALHEAGHGLEVEPGDEFELADELADALLAGTDGWQLVEKPKGKGKAKAEPAPEPSSEAAPANEGAE
jgi:hypothetical protein